MSAGNVATAYVRLRPNAAGFQREAQAQVEGALSGLRKSAAFLIGAGGIAEGLKGIVEAAAGKQSAVAQVELAVRNAGAQWKVYGQTVTEALDKAENKTGYDFETLAQGFGRLEQQTKNTKESLGLLGTAEDVARARHLELTQVTIALSKAAAGNATSLQRLGIIVPKYTATLDVLKQREHDVELAQKASAQAGAKKYQGTIGLTEAQRKLAALSPIQLQNLALELKAQEAGAAATDKRKSSELAIAEVTKRYSGQSEAYAKTAAGAYARFRVAVQQVAETIGAEALPGLTRLATEAAAVALRLSQSERAGQITRQVLHDIAGGAQAVVTAYHALEPALRTAAELAQALGPGPILAGIAAYKALGLVQSAQTLVEARYQGLVKAGTPVQAARLAEQQALVAAQAEAVASGTRLIAYEAAIADGYSATTAATIANNGALVSNTEATTLNLAAKIRSGEVEALIAEGYSAQTAAVIANDGALVTNTELTAANTLAKEANVAANAETAVAAGGLRTALSGVGAALTGTTGITIGLAAAAAGIYYLSTLQTDSARITDETTAAYNRAGAAAKAVGEATKNVQLATSDNGSAIRARADATDALAQARRDLDKLLESGQATSANVAEAERKIADREADWRTANQHVIDTENAKRDAVKKSTKAIDDQRKAQKDLIDEQVANLKIQASISVRAGAAANGIQPGDTLATLNARKVAASYRETAAGANAATAAQRFNLRLLADYIEATGKIPSEKETRIVLNDKDAYAAIANFEGRIKLLGTTLFSALTDAGGAAGSRGDAAIPVKTDKVKELGKKAGTDFTTAFVTHIDATSIRDALASALQSARGNLDSQTSAIASGIGSVLDERLRLRTTRATEEIRRLQGVLDAESAARSRRDDALAVTDAQTKLAQLQKIYGSGLHTSAQQSELDDATRAVSDAQQAVADNENQLRQKAIQDNLDAQNRANDDRKRSAGRTLDDLAADLDRGKITQEKYAAGVRAVLAKQGVSFKDAGKVLGSAFASGFQDAFTSALAQAKTLDAFGLGGLRRNGTATKPTNPALEEAKAVQALIDQIASAGGKFSVTGAGTLPGGLSLADIIARAGSQRASDAYKQPTGTKQDKGIEYAGRTADHTAQLVTEVKKLNAKPPVVVQVDGRKSKRKTAEATRS